ncbi:FGGY-family carbohydrate kinase [Oscillospiraceae bacterium MB08-C2-2]|nr:FGGY-family carbohydrate kinase [Oscillospiraceae bacterium MB08-C2-2]
MNQAKQTDCWDTAMESILSGKTYLGIELGSTRIKSVLIGEDHMPIASGSFDWENQFEDNLWTYHLDDVWKGIRSSYCSLTDNLQKNLGIELKQVGAIGISAMMHGYLVFDEGGNQLVPFRTWRNTTTGQAAEKLTRNFSFNIPQRWSIAHLYQAILNKEPHISHIAFMTTLAGYVHWKLSGEKVVGIGEASGIFPVDSQSKTYDSHMMEKFNQTLSRLSLSWRLENILPCVLSAGERGGTLTAEGAALLDSTGLLQAGIPMCPPEGDAGTGMVATNSIMENTGNVSAGTSVFATMVLEHPLSEVYTEIDMVATPTGKPAAMIHCNNCTSDLDAWVRLFGEVLSTFGAQVEKPKLYDELYFKALEGTPDGGGLVSFNYFSGEPITDLTDGRPLFARLPDSTLSLANFMRTLLFSTMATLKIGMNILTQKENVRLRKLYGHGGLFKTKGVGQKLMAAALDVPITVMESAGEGGPWGMALLAAFMMQKKRGETLEDFLANRVFADASGLHAEPEQADQEGFNRYMQRFTKSLPIQRAAVENLD